MIESKYTIGDEVRLTARFQDPVTGEALTPGEVTVEVLDPLAVTHALTAELDTTLETADGVTGPGYSATVDAELPGRWYYRWAATGVGQSAAEGSFYVEHSKFAEG